MQDDELFNELSKIKAKQLAKLLWEHAQTDSVLYEKCSLLAASKKSNKLETLVREKLASFSSSTCFYDWRSVGTFASELDYVRDIIVSSILPDSPELAAELLEEFV